MMRLDVPDESPHLVRAICSAYSYGGSIGIGSHANNFDAVLGCAFGSSSSFGGIGRGL
jgi:hypothetical protein